MINPIFRCRSVITVIPSFFLNELVFFLFSSDGLRLLKVFLMIRSTTRKQVLVFKITNKQIQLDTTNIQTTIIRPATTTLTTTTANFTTATAIQPITGSIQCTIIKIYISMMLMQLMKIIIRSGKPRTIIRIHRSISITVSIDLQKHTLKRVSSTSSALFVDINTFILENEHFYILYFLFKNTHEKHNSL